MPETKLDAEQIDTTSFESKVETAVITGAVSDDVVKKSGDTITGNLTIYGNLNTSDIKLTGGLQFADTVTALDTIEYIDTTTTTGNAIASGTLTVARDRMGEVYGSKYGFFAGGYVIGSYQKLSVIDYIDITITSMNAMNRGDLTIARYNIVGV